MMPFWPHPGTSRGRTVRCDAIKETDKMNYKRHNQDLQILQSEAARLRHGRRPGWTRVDWKPTPVGGNMIYLRQVSLPPTCSVARTDIRIEAPPNLYEPAGGGFVHFFRNLFISPGIQ